MLLAAVLLGTAAAAPWVGAADVHHDTVVFVAADRLWTAPLRGGRAVELPVPPGEISTPVLSPDGTQVAFAARHDGNQEVYTLALDDAAATPVRQTFHPDRDLPVAWDAEGLVVRSNGHHPLRAWEQRRLGPSRWLREGVALTPGPTDVWTTSDTSWMAWQGYQGGLAPQLQTDAGTLGPGDQPAWSGGRLWFLHHERAADGAFEGVLVSSAPDGSDRRIEARGGVTALAGDADGTLVFVREGSLWRRSPEGRVAPVRLRLPLPDPGEEEVAAADFLEGSSEGVAWARGQLIVGEEVVAGRGRLGPAVVAGGEVVAWDGAVLRRGPGLAAVVPGSEALRGVIALRAGTDWLAAVQWTGEVVVLPRAGGTPRVLGRSVLGPVDALAFGSDDRLAFTLQEQSGLRTVWRWQPDMAEALPVTGPRTDDHAPWWGEDGRLYLVAERAPQLVVDARDVATVVGDAATSMVLSDRAWTIDAGSLESELSLAEATPPPPPDPPDLDGVTLTVDLRDEWRQAVRDSCAMARDLRWDPGLGGRAFDTRDSRCTRAEAAVERLYTRRELQDLLRQLLGSFGVGHAAVFGGLPRHPRGETPALLGAELQWRDDGLHIERVFRPDPTLPTATALTPRDEGMCIFEIDGQRVDPAVPVGSLLLGKAGQELALTTHVCGDGGQQQRTVVPLSSERELRYSDWLRRTWHRVDDRSDGRVGYLHLPDLGETGMARFEAMFHGQRDREALVVDLRGNGGGWLSDAVADRLRRHAVAAFHWTGGGRETWPIRSAPPKLVFLVDGATQSEGEVLAAGAQAEGLGVVVGTPTWGGLSSGLAGRPLADGGVVLVPGVVWEDPVHGRSLENQGVAPDVLAEGDAALDIAALDLAIDIALGRR